MFPKIVSTIIKPVTALILVFGSIFSLYSQEVFIPENSSEWEKEFFDRNTVDTILGTVISVDKQVTPLHKYYGISVKLRTDHGDFIVYVGPHWFLQRQNLSLAPGDRLEVTGSRLAIDDVPSMIAAEVRKNQVIYRLRNKYEGTPLWRA